MSTAVPCTQCGIAESNSTCTQCGIARYCGRDCQTQAWKTHKKVCIPKRAVMPTCSGCGGWGVGLLQSDGKCRHCGGDGGFASVAASADATAGVGHSHGGVACSGHH